MPGPFEPWRHVFYLKYILVTYLDYYISSVLLRTTIGFSIDSMGLQAYNAYLTGILYTNAS
jgi:hypothetical protein